MEQKSLKVLPEEIVINVDSEEDARLLTKELSTAKGGEQIIEVLDRWAKKAVAILTDDELKKELESRMVKRKDKTLQENADYVGKLEKALTIELINILVPRHGRKACSDSDTCNGFGSQSSSAPPRCSRCALIEIMGGMGRRYIDPDSIITLELGIEVSKA